MKTYAPNNTGGAFSASNTQWIGNNYSGSGTGLFNSNSWTTREDYTFNEKMHAFARFSRFWDTLSGKVMFGAAGGPGFGIGGYGGNSNGANDSLASGMDIAISPKLLTDFRLGYYRYNVIDSKYDQGVEFANTLGIPGINTGSYFTSGAPGFVISNRRRNLQHRRRLEHQPLQLPTDRARRPVPDRQQLDHGPRQPHLQDWCRSALWPQPPRAV